METFVSQIKRLRQTLSDVAEAKPTSQELQICGLGVAGMPVDVKLKALQVAAMQAVAHNITNCHKQIGLAMDFARHVTFYARQISPNVEFWAGEINDDIEQQKFLFVRAQNDVECLVRQQGQAALFFARQQRDVLGEFNLRNGRRVAGQTLYAETEKPGDLSPAQAREKLIDLRTTQTQAALADTQGLIDHSLLTIGRMNFVQTAVKPLFAQAHDPAAAGWDDDLAASRATADKALDDAETVLTYHAARHSAFARRLGMAPTGP